MEIWRSRWESKSNQQARKRETTSLMLLSWKLPHLQLFLFISSSFSLSALCHTCHSFLTPVWPFLLSHCPISFSVGWNCLFLEVCLWGEGIPRCSRPPLLFQLITQNMTALLLFGAEMSCFSCPHGESGFSASFSSSWTSLQDSWSILCAWANATCFRPCTQTLCNFAMMWIEVTYQFSPRGLNVSLSAGVYRIVFPHIRCTWMEIYYQHWTWVLKAKNLQIPINGNQSYKIQNNQILILFGSKLPLSLLCVILI